MYVSEICAEGIFVTFPWWLKNVKSRSKIALFSNERDFESWFPKKRTITFFWSKLSKLHQKDPILHVATTFSLKQGETRTSHGPIPHPLNQIFKNVINQFFGFFSFPHNHIWPPTSIGRLATVTLWCLPFGPPVLGHSKRFKKGLILWGCYGSSELPVHPCQQVNQSSSAH